MHILNTYPSVCSIFSDVAGDITIVVDGEPFLLHKVSSFCLSVLVILFLICSGVCFLCCFMNLVSIKLLTFAKSGLYFC